MIVSRVATVFEAMDKERGLVRLFLPFGLSGLTGFSQAGSIS